MTRLATLLLASVLIAPSALAGEFEVTGEAAMELRVFPQEPQFAGQFDHYQPSITLQPDVRWYSDDGKHRAVFIPFIRLDAQDDERTHGDIREAYWRFISDDDWDVLVGLSKVFWGVTESRHLVDVINQTDTVEDIDEEDKLGQPMIRLSLLRDWGTLSLFAMPGFRDRTYPGDEGRLRGPLAVGDTSEFVDDRGRNNLDLAARYSHFFGNWDVGVSIFHGTGREPRQRIDLPTQSLVPVYDRITQGGLDAQYTAGPWLWKFEGIVREGQGDTFAAMVGGFEYTLYQIFETTWDLGLLSEYQYDGREETPAGVLVSRAPLTVSQNDVFVGARLALNDINDSEALIGTTVDVEDQSMGLFVEAERRFGNNWVGEVEGRFFLNVDRRNALDAFRDDSVVTFRITRYF